MSNRKIYIGGYQNENDCYDNYNHYEKVDNEYQTDNNNRRRKQRIDYSYNSEEVQPFKVPTKELFVLNSNSINRLKQTRTKNNRDVQKKSKRSHKIGKKIKKLKNTTSKVKQYIINSKRKKKTVSKYEEAIENAKKFSTILKAKSQKAIKRSNSVSKMDLETYYNKIMVAKNMLSKRNVKHDKNLLVSTSSSLSLKSLDLNHHDIFNKPSNISDFTSSQEKDLGYLTSDRHNNNNDIKKSKQQRPSSAPLSRRNRKPQIRPHTTYSCLNHVHKEIDDIEPILAKNNRKNTSILQHKNKRSNSTKIFSHLISSFSSNNNDIYNDGKPTFIISNSKKNKAYEEIAIALKQRGWIEETRKDVTPNLLWDISDNETKLKNKKRLGKETVYNHFKNNRCMTSKTGLRKSLEGLPWLNSTSASEFVPICYEIGESGGREDFKQEFIVGAAISILFSNCKRVNDENDNKLCLPYPVIMSCIVLLWFYIRESYINEDIYCTMFPNIYLNLIQNISPRNFDRENFQSIVLKCYYYLNNSKKNNKKKVQLENDLVIDNDKVCRIMDTFNTNFLSNETNDDIAYFNKKVCRFLKKFIYHFPNFALSKKYNTWIIKPGNSSRAVGLTLSRDMKDILHKGEKMSSRIVQRYIEQPYLMHKRKFDLRVWVLVTSLKPLKVYYFNAPYLRVCSKDYKIESSSEHLNDRYIHLSNCCVNRQNSSAVEKMENHDEYDIDGNVWSLSQFQTYLSDTSNNDNIVVDDDNIKNGKQIWKKIIEPKIKNIITSTLEVCAYQMEDLTKNSFELYGFDIILDDHLKPWLLEVNLSPFFSGRTSFLKQLIKKMVNGLMKLTVDKIHPPLTEKGSKLDEDGTLGKWEKLRINNSHIAVDQLNIFMKKRFDMKVVGKSFINKTKEL